MESILPKLIECIEDLNKVFPTEQSCMDYLTELRWNGNIESPFVDHGRIYVCKDNKFRCSATKKYFTVKTNTIFHNSRIPLTKWFAAIYLMTSENPSMTSVALGQKIMITQKTAWYMIERIRAYFGTAKIRKTRARQIKTEIAPTVLKDSTKNMSDWLQELKTRQ